MNDQEFLAAFEACTLTPAQFRHREHIRAAWLYLQTGSVLEALQRFTSSLQRFAASLGKASIYHETITWSYLLLIHERMLRSPAGLNFDAFAALPENADLFGQAILGKYYRAETLRSELARKVFLFPDT